MKTMLCWWKEGCFSVVYENCDKKRGEEENYIYFLLEVMLAEEQHVDVE